MAIVSSNGSAVNGALRLQREPASPRTLNVTDLNLGLSKILLLDNAYMSGDQVTLTVSTGTLPLTGAVSNTGTYYINRDTLDRISFYNTALGGINALPGNLITFTNDTWTTMSISQTAPPARYMADLESFRLDLDCAAIDVTPIGVRFGENIKDLITGAGSITFHVERRSTDLLTNAIDILELLLLTEPGAKVSAQFWLLSNRAASTCGTLAPGSIYYETDILFVSTNVTSTPEDLIKGAANFATTEEIYRRIAT